MIIIIITFTIKPYRVVVIRVCYFFVAVFTGSGGECRHGEIRLINGTNPFEGRIELCIDEQWGTVCDDRFQIPDAIVACRQLGFSDLGEVDTLSQYDLFFVPIKVTNYGSMRT